MRYLLALFISIYASCAGAATSANPVFISSSKLLNYQSVLSQLKTQSNLPVIFPNKIPKDSHHTVLYMSSTSSKANAWQINVDTTADCQGVRVCNVGFVSAARGEKLEREYQTLPGNKTHLKEQIRLSNHLMAYYTPFHIQAGAVNPTLQWQENQILYTITWRIDAPAAQQKQILVAIAHSALR